MAYLDLHSFVLTTIALVASFFIAEGALGCQPRGEESGRIEMVLKIADYLCRGYGRGFVDC